MRAARLRAAIRRGWVWPIFPRAPRPSSRQIFGSCVVLPEPVSPHRMTTGWSRMAASIDSVSHVLPPEMIELMKLSPRADQTVRDIADHVSRALHIPEVYKESLRSVTIEKYDWSNISAKLSSDLYRL